MIEVTQLLTRVGSFDVDDIILNTLGGVLGIRHIFRLQPFKEKILWLERKTDTEPTYTKRPRIPEKGYWLPVLGGVSLLIFLLLAGICAALAGGAGEWSGSVGFTAFAAAFYGLVTGLESFHQPSKSYFFSKLGTLLCGFMVAVWFLIFCLGLAGI